MRTEAFAPIILSIVLFVAACGEDAENSSLTVEAETTTSTTSTTTTDAPVDEDPVVEAETTTPQTTTDAPPDDDSVAEAETVDAEELTADEDVELAFDDPAGYYLVEHLAAELGGTAETREGAIVRGTQDAFVVDYKSCCTDDNLYASITSLEDNAVFTIYAPDGQVMLVEATSANLLLEQGGEYWVVVGATRGNASYTVEIGLSQNAN
jgi:hypothetical protein